MGVPAAADKKPWSDDMLRLNSVCPYYTMFPLDFPLQQLAKHPGATRVLDPFCGRGTTLYAARLAGLPSVGIDINPVAAAIAQAKLIKVHAGSVIRLAQTILDADGLPEVPRGDFWDLCYEPSTLVEIAKLRAGLLRMATPTAAMLRAVLLGILHGPKNKGLPSYLSNQMPRTYASKPAYAVKFWSTRNLRPERVSTIDVLKRRVDRILKAAPPASGGRVHLGDSVEILSGLSQRFDLVVTSPPYYGMRTYVADQWIRSWFLGGEPDVPYTTHGQIARQPNQQAFVDALANVWRTTAQRCRPNARLAIRFGALPSKRTEPAEMIVASIKQAKAGWHIKEVQPAGTPSIQTRQAGQFGRAGSAVEEIDVTADLIGVPH